MKFRPRLTESEYELILNSRKSNHRKTNVLVVGDLHLPFTRKGYLEHCIKVYDDYQCNKVIFIGDILDNHYSSYHESNPDGMSAGDELEFAVDGMRDWAEAFPDADSIVGNHDAIIIRKAFSNGLSKRWIKDYKDVLGVKWNFQLSFEYDGVLYVHGEGGGGINGALQKALNRRKSIVQGHFHTEAHIRWNVSDEDRLFAMQIGCGVDDKAYAMEYAKFNTKKSIISCGLVLDNGNIPLIIPMEL